MDDTETLTKESEYRVQSAIALTQQTIKVGVTALKKFPTAEYELLVFTFINYLDRFTYSLESIEILLSNFKKKPNVETSIGLIIRASLLDFMTVTFISSYQADITPDNPNGQEDFDKQFDALVSDQMHNTIKYLLHMRENNLIKQDEFELTIKNLNHTYNFLFNELNLIDPVSSLKTKMFKSPKQIFTRIYNHPATKKFAMVYDLYTYYSKYEHFGIMTHFMQRQSINQDLDRIIWSTSYIIRGLGMSLAYLNYPSDMLVDEMEKLNKLTLEFDKLGATNK